MKRRLQVFVSSTYVDLVPERQAAVAAILKAGHIPAGMELFTAGDKSQMQTIERWIDESDVYMLILGGRYGSIEPTSGVSYTELEYDYATQHGKPTFAVVITEAAIEQRVKAFGTTVLERDNNKELALFRNKVLSNISSFFDDVKDIRLCVHETLADFSSTREFKGWVRADEVVDTKPLFAEIQKLSEENAQLKGEIAELQKLRQPQSARGAETFNELRRLLAAIDVKVPAAVAGGQDATMNLLNIFFGNKETLLAGVTNRSGIGAVESFFYFNVCPKLQVHGLAMDENVLGTRYRRYSITELGRALLADIEKQLVLPKKPALSAADTPSKSSEPSPSAA